MKKLLLFSLLCITLLVALTGCLSKTAITADSFKSSMESMNYVVVDYTSQFDSEDVKKVYAGINPTGSFQIEFFELGTESLARSSYLTNLETMEKSKGSMSSSTSFTGTNYEKATQTSNNEYWLVSRVENTFIFVHSSDTNKDAINKVVDSLGY